ncbi:MAG: alpha/beta hydrolase [Deltaproteobacteria bacterium]
MNRQTVHRRLLEMMALAVLIMTGLAGCSYLSIPAKDDVVSWPLVQKSKNGAPVYNSAVIKGRITGAAKDGPSTLVIAARADSRELADSLVANQTGAFMLYLPAGRYHFYAAADYNDSGTYEPDELSGVHGSFSAPQTITLHENDLVANIVIRTVRPNANPAGPALETALPKTPDCVRQVTYNGQVFKIYHDYFSLQNAQTGYWQPSSFMKVFGAHIYLTEEYSPRKIPILFVHGTEGSPHNWIYFYTRLDRNRYQPWFFFYPSGIRLNLAASLLDEELGELQKKYGFQKMALVAHSVGGLTTRSFLTRFVRNGHHPFIKLFVSFATPWSGFSAADASQILPHKSIPVWMDLGTQSPFIKTTLEDKMPPDVRHYIFYGKNDALCGNKALDERATAGAAEIFAFNCDHTSILNDRRVFSKFHEILDRELGTAK